MALSPSSADKKLTQLLAAFSIGNDNPREIEYARVNLEDTNVGIVMTNAAQHCVMRIEIQVRLQRGARIRVTCIRTSLAQKREPPL